MEYLQINFNDFLTEEAYGELQFKFRMNDIYFDFEPNKNYSKTVTNNFIIHKEQWGESGSSYIEIDFETDFLIDEINKLAKKNLKDIFKKSKTIYGEESKTGFFTGKLDLIRNTMREINEATYLSESVKSELELQLNELETEIIDLSKNPYQNLKFKVQFKWSKIDVVYLFHLLKENRCINNISSGDLGKILDSAFEYKNDKNEYEAIKMSRSLLSKFVAKHTPSTTASIERLKNVFSNDFYNV